MNDRAVTLDQSRWLYDPATFDHALYADPPGVLYRLEQIPMTDAVIANRRAMAAFVVRDKVAIDQAVRRLPVVKGPLFPGIYHLIGTLHPAIALPDYPIGTLTAPTPDLLEMEGLCLHATALAHRQMREGLIENALQNLYLARVLAKTLGMRHRAQLLTVEFARVEMLAGRTSPDLVQRELQIGMPARRREWTERTLAEMLMTRGDYPAALQALGTANQDGPLHASLRTFLHALLRLPAVMTVDTQNNPYAQLALTVRSLQQGDNHVAHAGHGFGEPEAGYAVLLEALALQRSRSSNREANKLLLSRAFVQPDQRALQSAFLMGGIADGSFFVGSRPARRSPWTTYGEAMAQLTNEAALLGVLRHLCVDRLALLSFSPTSSGRAGYSLSSLPLLAGQVIRYQGGEFKLPGRAGKVRVLEALGLPHDELHRNERRRLRMALAEYGQPVVNLGWLLRGCLRMSVAAQIYGESNDAVIWKHAADQIKDMLTPCVKIEIGTQLFVP